MRRIFLFLPFFFPPFPGKAEAQHSPLLLRDLFGTVKAETFFLFFYAANFRPFPVIYETLPPRDEAEINSIFFFLPLSSLFAVSVMIRSFQQQEFLFSFWNGELKGFLPFFFLDIERLGNAFHVRTASPPFFLGRGMRRFLFFSFSFVL